MSLMKVSLVAILLALNVVNAFRFDYEGRSIPAWSVGPAGVWVINNGGKIYYNEDTRFHPEAFDENSWSMVWDGQLVQLDVGTDIVWGVNEREEIFYRANITSQQPKGLSWRRVTPGYFTHVTVSPGGCVWTVDRNDYIFYRKGASTSNPTGTVWEIIIHGHFSQVSAGNAGVWAINANGQVYYREGTFGGICRKGSGWSTIEGGIAMKYISSGDEVYGVGKGTGNIYHREGISESYPIGTRWRPLTGVCDTLDTYSDALFTCKYSS